MIHDVEWLQKLFVLAASRVSRTPVALQSFYICLLSGDFLCLDQHSFLGSFPSLLSLLEATALTSKLVLPI